MIEYENIRNVHLEVSSLCNARCPLCPRNLCGVPYNNGRYIEANLTLFDIKRVFLKDFIKQLQGIYINGNFGDFVMNPESLDIVKFFHANNQDLKIRISSNSSARNKDFWRGLGQIKNVEVEFCLDGLEDTHHLYRQSTSWTTIIQNAKTFIAAGGHAIWKFIVFDHNKHQINRCEQLSKELGFRQFDLWDHGRNTGPVFDKHGKYTHALGNYNEHHMYRGETDFKKIKEIFHGTMSMSQLAYTEFQPKTDVSCQAKNNQAIYISSIGDVFPCCWLGFPTNTHGKNIDSADMQVEKMATKNNVLQSPLKECIQWFTEVEKSWKINSYRNGRLVLCDKYCGSTN
jgi:MoaA/NifB/PqqE/SkfB family radical SAM enzyme